MKDHCFVKGNFSFKLALKILRICIHPLLGIFVIIHCVLPNKNANIYENNTHEEIKRKKLLDYKTNCIVKFDKIQLNENKSIHN